MRLAGRVIKAGRRWAIEVPLLGVFTQGHTRKDAYEMVADAIEALVNQDDFRVTVYPGKGGYFEVDGSSDSALMAFLLRRARTKSGLSLKEVAERLGAKSHNAYARYEQGQSVPSIQKLTELYAAVASNRDLVLDESQA